MGRICLKRGMRNLVCLVSLLTLFVCSSLVCGFPSREQVQAAGKSRLVDTPYRVSTLRVDAHLAEM